MNRSSVKHETENWIDVYTLRYDAIIYGNYFGLAYFHTVIHENEKYCS